MTPTKEQLELAAKAAGYKLSWFRREGFEPQPTIGDGAWLPVTSKSDSFDLMVTCGIELMYFDDHVSAHSDFLMGISFCVEYKDHNNDKGLATMQAVFLCDVEIGRSL
jgi:hypothetical protein